VFLFLTWELNGAKLSQILGCFYCPEGAQEFRVRMCSASVVEFFRPYDRNTGWKPMLH
jgi:hypothetical protein